VFANLAAKPERGEKDEDLPPVRLSILLEPQNTIRPPVYDAVFADRLPDI
jgi:hypothetical protein